MDLSNDNKDSEVLLTKSICTTYVKTNKHNDSKTPTYDNNHINSLRDGL